MASFAGRTIVVGDVHGCYQEMLDLLTKVKYQKKHDRLIFVGDLINKGPDSLAVLDFVKNIGAEVVIGNHEVKFLRYLQNHLKGGDKLQKLKQQMGKDLDYWCDWLMGLPSFIEGDDFIVVHGGLAPNRHPRNTDLEVLTTIRTWDGKGKNLANLNNPAWYDLYRGNKHVIFGHWAGRGLVRTENATGLDSGCVYGNELSCLIWPDNHIVQVTARSCYAVAI